MKHFLTVERILDYKNVIEQRKYYFDHTTRNVVEEISLYVSDTSELIQDYSKSRTVDYETAMINLEHMLKHPGIIYKNNKFISWFCDCVLEDVFVKNPL